MIRMVNKTVNVDTVRLRLEKSKNSLEGVRAVVSDKAFMAEIEIDRDHGESFNIWVIDLIKIYGANVCPILFDEEVICDLARIKDNEGRNLLHIMSWYVQDLEIASALSRVLLTHPELDVPDSSECKPCKPSNPLEAVEKLLAAKDVVPSQCKERRKPLGIRLDDSTNDYEQHTDIDEIRADLAYLQALTKIDKYMALVKNTGLGEGFCELVGALAYKYGTPVADILLDNERLIHAMAAIRGVKDRTPLHILAATYVHPELGIAVEAAIRRYPEANVPDKYGTKPSEYVRMSRSILLESAKPTETMN